MQIFLIYVYLVTESQILNCIADDKCREMLSVIKEGRTLSIDGLQLTRKQFYSRLHALIIYNLISKVNGKYRLTSFGKVVFDWHLVLMQAISEEYWKLKALDVLDSSGIPDSERAKIMDALVKNEKLRQFIRA
jgi:predicted transcriptional regulator